MRYFGFDRRVGQHRRFGFAKTANTLPEIAANFVTQSYTKDTVKSSFAELFAFTRNSKAWLFNGVDGMDEYAVNEPRITSKGLLIEQESTNLAYYSFLPPGESLYAYVGNVTFRDGTWKKRGSGTGALYPSARATPNPVTASVQVLDEKGMEYIILDIAYNTTVMERDRLYVTRRDNLNNNRMSGLLWDSNSTYSYTASPIYWQVEEGQLATSPIKTAREPVTRAADLLALNNTANTVTGDWDSTLSLSIVDGKLIHSGYGQIRSLMIK